MANCRLSQPGVAKHYVVATYVILYVCCKDDALVSSPYITLYVCVCCKDDTCVSSPYITLCVSVCCKDDTFVSSPYMTLYVSVCCRLKRSC